MAVNSVLGRLSSIKGAILQCMAPFAVARMKSRKAHNLANLDPSRKRMPEDRRRLETLFPGCNIHGRRTPQRGIINPSERPTTWSSALGARNKPACSGTACAEDGLPSAPCLPASRVVKDAGTASTHEDPRPGPASSLTSAVRLAHVVPWAPVVQSASGQQILHAHGYVHLPVHNWHITRQRLEHLANSLQDAANSLSNAAQRCPSCPAHPFLFRARTNRKFPPKPPFGLPHCTSSHSR